jgi:hypothetical protein
MWLWSVKQGVSKITLQWYSKCYWVANVTKTFTLKGVRTIHRSTSWKINSLYVFKYKRFSNTCHKVTFGIPLLFLNTLYNEGHGSNLPGSAGNLPTVRRKAENPAGPRGTIHTLSLHYIIRSPVSKGSEMSPVWLLSTPEKERIQICRCQLQSLSVTLRYLLVVKSDPFYVQSNDRNTS